MLNAKRHPKQSILYKGDCLVCMRRGPFCKVINCLLVISRGQSSQAEVHQGKVTAVREMCQQAGRGVSMQGELTSFGER
jgi:hypothetical protein